MFHYHAMNWGHKDKFNISHTFIEYKTNEYKWVINVMFCGVVVKTLGIESGFLEELNFKLNFEQWVS